ncbi:hypothetical protein B566_EDAN009544 [Ephemera danica]|nr:hypothetical protein B566_EDAN009544 [Ephemera danica]
MALQSCRALKGRCRLDCLSPARGDLSDAEEKQQMRRPVICGGADQTGAEPPGQPEGALSRVRRLLSGSLPGRKNRNTFGVRLEDLLERSDAQDGIPFAVIRLCSYIEEAHGLEHEGGAFHATANQKLVEKLKVAFDRNGDADLEASGDVNVAVALLKLFLRELPEPAITETAADDMLHAIRGSRGDVVPEMRKAFSAMPEANRQLVRYLAAFMRLIVRRECENRTSAPALGVVFGPSLIRHRSFAQQNACNQIATRLITDFHSIFPESATLDEVMAWSQIRGSGPMLATLCHYCVKDTGRMPRLYSRITAI